MQYQIRPAKLDDIPKVINLAVRMVEKSRSPFRNVDVETIRAYRKQDLSSLYQHLANPSAAVIVAENSEGDFLGHVIVTTHYLESSTGEVQGYVFDLSVKEEYQGLGVGKNLMETAEEFCYDNGMKYVCLNVTSSNKQAVGFYEKIGYEEERKRMIKVLKPPADNTKDQPEE